MPEEGIQKYEVVPPKSVHFGKVPASGDIRPWSKLRSFYCLSRSFQLFWMSFPLSWFLIKSKVHFAPYLHLFFYEYLIAQAWLVVSFQLWTKYVGSHCHLSPSKALTSCRARPSARWGKRWTAVGEQLQIGLRCTHIFSICCFACKFCSCLSQTISMSCFVQIQNTGI